MTRLLLIQVVSIPILGISMGKKGPKARFKEVACPNSECPDY